MHIKICFGVIKWLLRQVLYKHMPQELVEHLKTWFDAPMNQRLRGSLCDWVESLLAPERPHLALVTTSVAGQVSTL